MISIYFELILINFQLISTILENFILPKKQDTIENHHNKHTIEDQGCSWTTPLKNCLNAVFKLSFNKASYILGNGAFLRIPKEAKKEKKRKAVAKERKRRAENDFGKFLLPKKNLDTIEDHPNKHTIEGQGCSWTTPLKHCLGAYVLGIGNFSENSK